MNLLTFSTLIPTIANSFDNIIFSNQPRQGFGFPPDGLFTAMFTIVPLLVAAGFAFVIFQFIRHGVHYAAQKRLPIIEVPALVIAKRNQVHGGGSGGVGANNHHHHHRTYTHYYATFETNDGTRLELQIPQQKIGYLIEGDRGILKHQGTIYHDFDR